MHNTKGTHQTTRKETRRRQNRNKPENCQKTMKKMAISTHLSVTTHLSIIIYKQAKYIALIYILKYSFKYKQAKFSNQKTQGGWVD